MRPVTFARIAEAIREIGNERATGSSELAELLEMTTIRSKEVVREASRIGLVCESGGRLKLTERGNVFADICSKGQWSGLHAMMMQTSPYSDLARLLEASEEPLAPSEILALTTYWSVPLNSATVDVLLDWTERLGFTQRNVFTGRHYCLNGSTRDFERTLTGAYKSMNKSAIPWLPRSFVEIPRLREDVCEQLRISREAFNGSFEKAFRDHPGRLELSGAPLVTHAKKSLRKVKNPPVIDAHQPHPISLTSQETLEGILISGRNYYFVAIRGGSDT